MQDKSSKLPVSGIALSLTIHLFHIQVWSTELTSCFAFPPHFLTFLILAKYFLVKGSIGFYLVCDDVVKQVEICTEYWSSTMGLLVLVYLFIVVNATATWKDWLNHWGQILNHEHNLSLVKFNLFMMAVGNEGERLEPLRSGLSKGYSFMSSL